jgi:preprotein translocase subunit YajC
MLFGDGYMIQPLEDLEELNSDYINEHYGSLQDDAYQRGLDDAWEAARKIIEMTSPPYWEVFNEYKEDLFGKISAAEAIAKLKAYEEKQKADDEIKVGDEVKTQGGIIFVVTKVTVGNLLVGLTNDGSHCIFEMDRVVKTGRYFDIDKIFKEMKEEDFPDF